jgi:hypothetical protein
MTENSATPLDTTNVFTFAHAPNVHLEPVVRVWVLTHPET